MIRKLTVFARLSLIPLAGVALAMALITANCHAQAFYWYGSEGNSRPCVGGCLGKCTCLVPTAVSNAGRSCRDCDPGVSTVGWQWNPSPDEEHRVVASLYNRYCTRCHGVDGRGNCDIPDVPDFTNTSWQASRTDEQLARLTYEGRGALMPAFRGTLTVDEACAMARYLRRFGTPNDCESCQFNPVERQYVIPSPSALINQPPQSFANEDCSSGNCRGENCPRPTNAPLPRLSTQPFPVFSTPPLPGDSLMRPGRTESVSPPKSPSTNRRPAPTKQSRNALTNPSKAQPTFGPPTASTSPIFASPLPLDGEESLMPENDFIKPSTSSGLTFPELKPFIPKPQPIRLMPPDTGIDNHRQLSFGSLLPPVDVEPSLKPIYPETNTSSFRIYPSAYPSTEK